MLSKNNKYRITTVEKKPQVINNTASEFSLKTFLKWFLSPLYSSMSISCIKWLSFN